MWRLTITPTDREADPIILGALPYATEDDAIIAQARLNAVYLDIPVIFGRVYLVPTVFDALARLRRAGVDVPEHATDNRPAART